MPNINDFLSSVFSGATHPKGTMGDFQHAARLYGDNTFALAPKASWMYYVFFSINPSAKTLIGNFSGGKAVNRDLEAGMLVKSCDLPKFQIQTEQLNQYNRRTVVQTKINYQPVSLSFHDDMSNITNSLWWNYYRYYYKDSTYGSSAAAGVGPMTGSSAYSNTKYKATTPVGPSAYGLNNSQGEPFFNSIIIYQMNRKFFTSYILVNPIISQWDHDKVDQTSGNKTAESKMTVQYESVFYGQGQIKIDNPPGFATFHYDLSPSPLSIQGGGTSTLFGPGGVIAGATEIFGDIENMATNGVTAGGLFNLVRNGANTIKNAGKLSGSGISQELLLGATGLIGGIATSRQIPSSVDAGTGGGGVGVALNLGGSSTAGFTNASAGSLLGGNLGGALGLAGVGAAAVSLLGTPLTRSTTPTNGDAVATAQIANQTDLQTAQALVLANQDTQAKFQLGYQQALATGGQAAADAFAQQAARTGYTDPVKLAETVNTLQANSDILAKQAVQIQAVSVSNPYLSPDADTSGPIDPKAALNTAGNQDSNITNQPVQVADASIPDTNYWSA